MAPQAGHGDGTGSTPGPDPLPGGTPEPGPVPRPPRGAPRIPEADPAGAAVPCGFARGGQWDACPPSAALATASEAASGPGWSCDGLARDDLVGLLRQWQALESWAAAGKLGVLRALIREEDQPLPGGSYRGGLPEGWTKSLTHEVAAALAVSVTSAENLMWLAWDLQVRLPGTGELLAAGHLTLSKARAVDQALTPLTDEDAAAAEAMIITELGGKTHSQVAGLAAQAAITIDPESATRRREEAERSRSRLLMFREDSGAAGLSGRDLPTDQALAAHERVCERAAEYNDSGVFGEARMDQLRATAYLDLINGVSARDRITAGHLATGPEPGTADGQARDTAHADPASGDAGPINDEGGAPSDDPDRGPASGDPRSDDPRGDDPGYRVQLTITESRLKHLAEIATDLAPPTGPPGTSTWQLTRNDQPPPTRDTEVSGSPGAPGGSEPPESSGPSGGSATPAAFGPPGGFRPPEDFGRWMVTLPGGGQFTVAFEPMPTFDCDHRHESHAYQPNDTLRHLVQVRDGECTFPPCSRHARETDFEHAVPYDRGGRTCACNAGSRSRQCHRVKQAPGWNLTQPKPGWHQWTTPAGRSYTQGSKRYPV